MEEGNNINFGRGEGNIKSVVKNITWKKGNGKKFPLPFSIKAAEKNIKRGRGKFIDSWEENNNQNEWVGEKYQGVGKQYNPTLFNETWFNFECRFFLLDS